MRLTEIFCFLITMALLSDVGCGQENKGTEDLKQQIATLQEELLEAQNEIAALRDEIKQLTEDPKKGITKKKKTIPLSDRLPVGAVLEGDYRSDFVVGVGIITVTIEERDDKKLKGKAVVKYADKDPVESNAEGVIKGNQLTLRTVGGGNPATIVVQMKGDGLEGRYRDSQQNKGTVGLRLPPVE